MARLRDLEPGEAGLLARFVHTVMRNALGRELNPHKVMARSPRVLLVSFLGNIIMGSGRWEIGRDLAQLVRTRAAALNGCPF
jgi:alkylhydroperoxidase family enzyme